VRRIGCALVGDERRACTLGCAGKPEMRSGLSAGHPIPTLASKLVPSLMESRKSESAPLNRVSEDGMPATHGLRFGEERMGVPLAGFVRCTTKTGPMEKATSTGRMCHIDLVDFGLSSNVNERDGFETPVGQEIGNRFLRVPEFRPESANRDDSRTDLTLAVGILFFLLTRQNPRVLLDEQGRFPHQRSDATALLKRTAIPQPERLIRIFDQGFQHDLDRRFQSAEILREALQAILEPEATGAKADALQRRILEHAQSPAVVQGQATMQKLHAIRGQIDGLCDRMLGELGGVVSRLGGPVAHADMRQASLGYETGFLYSRDTRVQIMLGFLMRHVGTEILVSVYSNRASQAEIRVPAATAQLTADDLERIREVYLSKLAAVPGAV
jgi:hypothetical protein